MSLPKRPVKIVVIGDEECGKKEVIWSFVSGGASQDLPADWEEAHTHVCYWLPGLIGLETHHRG